MSIYAVQIIKFLLGRYKEDRFIVICVPCGRPFPLTLLYLLNKRSKKRYLALNMFSSTGANCSVNSDNNTFNPQLLFRICLDYVAKNISLVESLDGFPDIVGEELFRKVQEEGGFGSDPKNLKLFCEAYGIQVLSKLSLSASHLLTNNYLEHLQLFVCLTELDVSHCRLGDSHDLLSYIAHLHG